MADERLRINRTQPVLRIFSIIPTNICFNITQKDVSQSIFKYQFLSVGCLVTCVYLKNTLPCGGNPEVEILN